MISISLCMIVKDEEARLAACLECIKNVVDEIIIVDTGSTDQTKEIAKVYTDLIFDYTWKDDFAEARNFSFSKASKEYILWLDADDRIVEEDEVKLKQLKQHLQSDVDVVMMKYQVSLGVKEMEGVFWRERLVRRERNFKWQAPVHEYLVYTGKITYADISVWHAKKTKATRRNLEIFEKYMAQGHELDTRSCYYYARELWQQHDRDKAAVYFEKYLEGKGGLSANYLDASCKLSKYYEEKNEEKKSLEVLLKYFEKDGPRAEICCKLGSYYKERMAYDQAIAWFKLAPYTERPAYSAGVVMPFYWDYIPYMELCACYYRKGDLINAIFYNEKAAQAMPGDQKASYNRVFLAMEQQKLLESKVSDEGDDS